MLTLVGRAHPLGLVQVEEDVLVQDLVVGVQVQQDQSTSDSRCPLKAGQRAAGAAPAWRVRTAAGAAVACAAERRGVAEADADCGTGVRLGSACETAELSSG